MVQANTFSGPAVLTGPVTISVEAGAPTFTYSATPSINGIYNYGAGANTTLMLGAPYADTAIADGTQITISGITGPNAALNGTVCTVVHGARYSPVISVEFTNAWYALGLPQFNFVQDGGCPGLTFNWN